MTQEERELLFKDLCARLPYKVKVHIEHDVFYDEREPYDTTLDISVLHNVCKGMEIKPYLRPMSSMTEEENKEFAKVMVRSQDCSYMNNESATTMVNDWYLSKGFDVRGLIPKGLALEASEGMYEY